MIGDKYSDTFISEKDTLQGSILVPIIIVMFINYLSQHKEGLVLMYAVDTTTLIYGRTEIKILE